MCGEDSISAGFHIFTAYAVDSTTTTASILSELVAPRHGFEPRTQALTAPCSTAELSGIDTYIAYNKKWGPVPSSFVILRFFLRTLERGGTNVNGFGHGS